MILLIILFIIVLGALAVLVVSENTGLVTIYVAYFEITTSIGVAVITAFALGLLTGVVAMFSREMFRWQQVGAIEKEK